MNIQNIKWENEHSKTFDYPEDNNTKSQKLKAVLNNDKQIYNITIIKENRTKPINIISKFFSFISKNKRLDQHADSKPLSLKDAQEKFPELKEHFKKMASNARIASRCGPDRLKEIYQQRNQATFSQENAKHYGEIMKAILKKASGLDEQVEQLNSLINEILDTLKNQPPSKEEFLDCIKKMKKNVIQQLDQLKGKGQGMKLFKQHYCTATNEAKDTWVTFKKETKLFDKKGKEINVKFSLKPANEIGCCQKLKTGQGISSLNRDTEHAMNLWETKAQLSESGKPLFQGIRHGCTRGKESASKEILQACLIQKLQTKQSTTSTSNHSSYGTFNNPHTLQLANIQLMTSGGMIGISTDNSLPEKQMDMFQTLAKSKQPIELTIEGKKVYVKLEEPLLFNFGTNLQQFNPIARSILTKDISKKNVASMELLLGSSAKIAQTGFEPTNINLENEKKLFEGNNIVEKFLNSNASDDDKKVVVQLAHQIAEIWQSGKYATDGSDPYAIQARIALLTYKLGLSTTFNCKSGKDRTGVANAEINNLAIETAMNKGIVPKPYQSLTDRKKFNLNKIINDSGANHITKACNGLCGLKIANSFGPLRFSGVQNRMGDVTGASSQSNG
ncbi:MAG: hypothetical protein LBH08_01640 [Puniceicoccales bacterium]|jgi:hypothetical protein|nr:hypothetical protein [Puniceicoccales bacterium]